MNFVAHSISVSREMAHSFQSTLRVWVTFSSGLGSYFSGALIRVQKIWRPNCKGNRSEGGTYTASVLEGKKEKEIGHYVEKCRGVWEFEHKVIFVRLQLVCGKELKFSLPTPLRPRQSESAGQCVNETLISLPVTTFKHKTPQEAHPGTRQCFAH